MMQHREGENGSIPFRSGRVFNVGTQWYFATREGLDHGPFADKGDVEAELMLFIRNARTVDQRLAAGNN